jgi:hypothetical protein
MVQSRRVALMSLLLAVVLVLGLTGSVSGQRVRKRHSHVTASKDSVARTLPTAADTKAEPGKDAEM